MAKTTRMPTPPNIFKKAYTESVPAKGSVGCTLHELCAADKTKVAKLLRQVVELERELTCLKAQGKKEKMELQEKTQHLRHRSADMLQENRMLKAKLTHAFALLRAYQHKVKHMDAAATSTPTLHSSNAVDFQKPQQLCCQHNVLLSSNVEAGRLDLHNGHAPSELMLSANRGCQHPADTARHDLHGSVPVPCTNPQQHKQAGAQASHTSVSSAGRQEPFAELASEVLACQQDYPDMEGTAQQEAAREACKVLRFDPALGTDGAFYFITSQSVHTQPSPPGQSEHHQVAADSLSSHMQDANAQGQQQHSGSTSEVPHQHMQPLNRNSAQVAAQSGRSAEGAQATGEKAALASPDRTCHPDSRDAGANMEEAGNAQVQLMQSNAAEDHREQQAEVQPQPAFPVQGGGEAGVLLRAAAAAAAGCSHELVVAAAGRAQLQEEPGPESRPVSHHETSAQPAIAAVRGSSPGDAAGNSPEQELKSSDLEPCSLPEPGQSRGQSGNEIAAIHESLLNPSAGRVEEDLQSLGFDSSLMDLVTEVEQMVAYRQANVPPADKQPAHDRGLPSRVALLHRYPSTQGHGEEEDFEENDVISLISDQEYSMH